MKQIAWTLLGCLALLATEAGAGQSQKGNEESLAKGAVIVRAVLIAKEPACDKYCWYRVKVLKIYKGANELNSPAELKVAALSGDAGVPTQECTLHLERYNSSVTGLWKLLDGKATSGVSSVRVR
jgi:hypothetical protein